MRLVWSTEEDSGDLVAAGAGFDYRIKFGQQLATVFQMNPHTHSVMRDFASESIAACTARAQVWEDK